MLLIKPNIPTSELKKINAETLVLAGEKDIILKNHTTIIADNIPNATLKILENQTHFAPSEDSALFNKTVIDFLVKN